jgi:hypothetical protein
MIYEIERFKGGPLEKCWGGEAAKAKIKIEQGKQKKTT